MKYLIRWLIRRIFNLIARVEVSGYEHLPAGESFVRQLADTLQAPVRAALSTQPMTSVFTLVGPAFNGIPGRVGLEDWGMSRPEGVRAFTGPPRPPQRSSERPLLQSTR